jgi:hypothetical protein
MSAVVRGLKTPKQVGKKMMRTGRMMLISTTMQMIMRAEFLMMDFRQKDNDVEHVHEKLPVHKDVYDHNEIQGYTDFRDAKDLGNGENCG